MPPSALAADDLAGYRKGLPALRAALAAYLAGYAPAARGAWPPSPASCRTAADLDAARRAFEPFSTAVADLARERAPASPGGDLDLPVPHEPGAGHRALALARRINCATPSSAPPCSRCGDEVK